MKITARNTLDLPLMGTSKNEIYADRNVFHGRLKRTKEKILKKWN